jgi:hypothetical protein
MEKEEKNLIKLGKKEDKMQYWQREKRQISVMFLSLFTCCLLLCGCWVYGQGSTIGYVTTVEGTSLVFHWDTVWFRVETGTYSSMQSQPEAYAIKKENIELKKQLLETCRKNQKIELIYQKHLWSMARSDDEIIGFKIIEK